MTSSTLPKFKTLPPNFPSEGAISLTLVEGITIFRTSPIIQNRIETLLDKQKESRLTIDEEKELDSYEELDDYLSLVNRTIRNLYLTHV